MFGHTHIIITCIYIYIYVYSYINININTNRLSTYILYTGNIRETTGAAAAAAASALGRSQEEGQWPSKGNLESPGESP